jgi:RHS repeat-associated protein
MQTVLSHTNQSFLGELTPDNQAGDWCSTYLFGFNGMEKDPEITGQEGSHYTTHFRAYDSRIGRWWSVDPVIHVNQSPYCAFDNNPVRISDPKGDDGDDGVKVAGQKTIVTNSEDIVNESEGEFSTILGLSHTVIQEVLSDPDTFKFISKTFNVSKIAQKYDGEELLRKSGVLGACITMASLVHSEEGANVSPATLFGAWPLKSGWASFGFAIYSMWAEYYIDQLYIEGIDLEIWASGENIDQLRHLVNSDFYREDFPLDKTLFFIYTSEEANVRVFDVVPTPILFNSTEEAEEYLGFKPEYVYYGRFEDMVFDENTGEFIYFNTVNLGRDGVKFE